MPAIIISKAASTVWIIFLNGDLRSVYNVSFGHGLNETSQKPRAPSVLACRCSSNSEVPIIRQVAGKIQTKSERYASVRTSYSETYGRYGLRGSRSGKHQAIGAFNSSKSVL